MGPTLLLLLALACPPLSAGQEDSTWTTLSGTTPAQWRVVWTESPSTRVTLSWSTAEEGREHSALLIEDPQPGVDVQGFTVVCQRNGPYTGADGGAFYHHARVTGLRPSTTYRFVLRSDGQESPPLHFTTAPADDRPFKIVYGGDSRTGMKSRQVMNRLMAELAEAHTDLLAFAHGGDYVFDGRVWPQWNLWLSHHELCTTSAGRVLPIVPVRGNHDLGPLYDEIFDDPGGPGRNHYVTRLSPEVALVTLNSEISTAGDQALWLEERLGELRPTSRWLLAQYHTPAWPAVKGPGPAKASWVPLFEQHDVDLVFESDGHVVKRTLPIRGDRHDPTGVTYIGEGGLGVPQRRPNPDRWYLRPPGMVGRGHHVTLFQFGPEELHMRTVGPPLPLEQFEPQGHRTLIAADGTWRYLAGEDPAPEWIDETFDDDAWPEGPAGFGYGDEDDATVLEDMRGSFGRVYLRRELPVADLEGCERLALLMRYDDGFIAYLEGQEVCRSKVTAGRGPGATGIELNEARSRYEVFLLDDWRSLLRGDTLTIAIEGHNRRLSSDDFSLQPSLIADPTNLGDIEAVDLRVIDEHALAPRPRAAR